MLEWFGKKRASQKMALIATLDDASVGVSLANLSPHVAVEILAADRMALSFEARTKEQSTVAIVQLFEQAIDKMLKAHSDVVLDDIHVVLRSPWTRVLTAQAAEEYADEQVITHDAITALNTKAAETITDLDAANILETGVAQIFLNGYPTGNPVGKRARSMTAAAFKSDVDAAVKRGVTEALGKLLPGRTPILHSGMRVLLTFLHAHIPDIHRYVVLDMSGTTTHCCVVRKEMITQVAEAPEGAASIIRRVAGTSVPEGVVTQLRMLAADTCSSEACIAVKDALARAEPDLAKIYGEMLAGLAQRRRLPNRAIIIAPDELLPWLQGFFSRIDFAQFTATTQPFETEALEVKHLTDAVLWKAPSLPDVRLALVSAGVNILARMA